MAEDVFPGCLRREIFAGEGTDLAGCPIHDDEYLVEAAGAVGKKCGVNDKILTGQVGVCPLPAYHLLYLFRSGKNANRTLSGHFCAYCTQTYGKYNSFEDCLHHNSCVVE